MPVRSSLTSHARSTPVTHRAQSRSDRGQLLPLFALVLALVVGIVVLVARIGRLEVEKAQARTAADAAALAGAVEGEDAAEEVARANGAQLESFRVEGSDAVVEVRLGPLTTSARARVGATTGAPATPP